MAEKQTHLPVGNCTKCGFTHSKPVGVRCKRQLNISVPAIQSGSNQSGDIQDVTPPLEMPNLPAVDTAHSISSSSVNTSQVNLKLDLILKKIENKNVELENKITTMRSEKPAVNPVHSSPEKSYKCSKTVNSGPPYGLLPGKTTVDLWQTLLQMRTTTLPIRSVDYTITVLDYPNPICLRTISHWISAGMMTRSRRKFKNSWRCYKENKGQI